MVQAFMPLFIAVAAAMTGLGMISPIFSSTYASVGGAELGPMFGRLSDRVGRRRMIALGLATYSVVSILYVVAESLMGARFLPTPARGGFGLGHPHRPGLRGDWRSVGVWWSPLGPLAVGGMGWASSLESRAPPSGSVCAGLAYDLGAPINPWMKMTGAAFQSRAASESTVDPTNYTPTNSHAATDQPKRQAHKSNR